MRDALPLADGDVIVIGDFLYVNGEPRERLVRLNADGSLDPTFVPAITLDARPDPKLLPTSDGGVYVAESIPDGTGQATLRIDRLTNVGAVASGFAAIELPETSLHDAARGPDDSLIVISSVNGPNAFSDMVKRYGSDGNFDSTFHPSVQSPFIPRS